MQILIPAAQITVLPPPSQYNKSEPNLFPAPSYSPPHSDNLTAKHGKNKRNFDFSPRQCSTLQYSALQFNLILNENIKKQIKITFAMKC